MHVAFYIALAPSIILTLLLLVALVRNTLETLTGGCKWSSPKSRVVLKPALLLDANTKFNLNKGSSNGKTIPNDQTLLSNDFVKLYS